MSLLHQLNAEQRRAVTTVDGPLLVLSGAGTGKTRTVTYRIAHMLAQGIAPSDILAVTFTNKAAREMKERVRALVGKQAAEVHISTFHSLGLRIIRENTEHLGYRPALTMCDASDQRTLIRKCLRRISVTWKKFKPEDVLYALSHRRVPGTDSVDVADIDAVDAAVYQKVWQEYRAALHAQNALDFDDLLHLPLKLLRAHTDIRDAYRARFRYILVDEYQDTNDTQFMLVDTLAAGHRNLCVVGDDDQSIYGWRGAQVRNILEFEQHYPEAVVVRLEENYRSTSTILSAANAVVAPTPGRKEKTLWTKGVAGEKLRCLGAPDDVTEADLIVTDIIENRRKTGRSYNAYAILLRMNTQARCLEETLQRYRLPYIVVGGMRFFDRKEVRDFLSYARILVNPADEEAFLRIVNVPARGAGEKTLLALHALAEKHHVSMCDALAYVTDAADIPYATAQQLAVLHSLIVATRERLETVRPSVVLTDFWPEVDYRRELEKITQSQEEIDNREACIRTVVEGIAQYEMATPRATLEGYLTNLMLDSQDDDEELEGERIAVMTIHASKGLEFPCVYVPGVEKNILPHIKSSHTVDGMAEERRLMYVAMTRAREELTLTYTKARMRFGKVEKSVPSPFLDDIPPEYLVHDEAACDTEATEDQADSFFQQMKDMLTGTE